MHAKDEHGRSLDPVSFIRHLHQDGLKDIKFKGIKLYPPLGYSPDDARLRPIWKYANDQKLPVISHYTHSAMTRNTNKDNGYGADRITLESFTVPSAYVKGL